MPTDPFSSRPAGSALALVAQARKQSRKPGVAKAAFSDAGRPVVTASMSSAGPSLGGTTGLANTNLTAGQRRAGDTEALNRRKLRIAQGIYLKGGISEQTAARLRSQGLLPGGKRRKTKQSVAASKGDGTLPSSTMGRS